VQYVELRAHSAFSFGDGTTSPEALVGRAAELGYSALGLTDTADLGGIIRFTLEAEKVGIKPICGAELNVDGYPTAFLAINRIGYKNLAHLVTKARVGSIDNWHKELTLRQGLQTPTPTLTRRRGHNLQQRYAVPLPDRGRPTITFDDLTERSDGLFCLTGPNTGEIATLLTTGRRVEAAYQLDRWRDVFGNRLAIEVQLHHAGGSEAALATSLIDIAERNQLTWVAANDPRYLDSNSRLVHELLTANRADVTVNTAAAWGLLLPNGEWRLKSPREMEILWQGRAQGLAATAEIAQQCQPFDLRWLRPPLPHYEVPAGHNDDTYLRALVYDGARVRWGELDERQRGQIEHELGVIERLGFAGFFIVMWDAVRFARAQDILCQGRGSAANSAVAYCLAITPVDPVKHGLLFERFLSEVRTDGRTEAPDIDVDFEMHRREEVLDYMYDTYKRQHSAICAVTQLYHAPTAVQDMMRALGYPVEQAFAISKRVHGAEPSEGAAAIEQGLGKEAGLEPSDARGRALLSALRALDDVPRLRSTHPGGFVLSCEPLGDYMPIEHTTMGRTIIQFDKDDLDAAGVPKFDFLGLGGLSAVHLSFNAIEERTGEKLEMYRLPLDDEKTYDLISLGDTVGTFQIESRAQIQSILDTRPERLYDIVVQVALIRPGPIQAKFVHPYTERRRGRMPVRYAHPLLEPILHRTYGVPIFQEQAMAIAMALGGFTASQADELRRAMGHQRKAARLHAALEKLKEACVARGVDESIAVEVVDDLHSFANYGFPESHAWSFALIAYATAYLKANYPTEFFLGMLNAWPMGFYPPATLVHDALRHGVVVCGPCMRFGSWDCDIVSLAPAAAAGEDVSLRYGFARHHPTPVPPPCARSTPLRETSSPSATDPPRIPFFRASSAEAPSAHPDVDASADTALKKGVASADAHISGARIAGQQRVEVRGVAELSERTEAVGGWGGGERIRSETTHFHPHPRDRAPHPDGIALRIGWRHIRGLGEKTRQQLQQAREDGPFTSIEDVVKRAQLTRADALHLARAGAFEAFEPGRRKAAWEALRAAGDMLPLAPARMLPFDPMELNEQELVFLDYIATGISVNGHPMQYLRERLITAGVASSRDLQEYRGGERIAIAGLVVARQHPETAKGTVFLLLEDEFGYMNVIVPKPMYERYREVVKFSTFLVIEGTFEREDRVMNIIGRRFRELKTEKIVARSRDFH
jgi:error-prone DNA polymerase